ncbi:MAG: NADH-quinone oxidoreductase subunit N, partial [Mangrovicoccus sp.]
MTASDFAAILPEIVLALYAMGALLAVVYTAKDKAAPMLTWTTAGLFLLVAFWVGISGSGTNVAFSGMFIDDAFSRFAKVTILLAAGLV